MSHTKDKRTRFFHSLAFKVGSVIILVEVVIFVASAIYNVEHFTGELERRIVEQIKTPGMLINHGVLTFDAIENKKIIGEIVGGELKDGLIIGLNHRVFYASDNDYVGSTIEEIGAGHFPDGFLDFSIKEPEIAYETNDTGKFLHCLSPLYASDGKTARFFVYLKVGTSWIAEQKNALIFSYAGSSLICVVATSLIILLFFNTFVLSKLKHLTKASQTVKHGQFNVDISERILKSKDEIGTMAKAFHIMTEDLRKTTTSIDNLNREISQRKQAEEELKEAKRVAEDATETKSLFLANMSHEIRTPLNGVIGMTGLLLDTDLSPEQQEYAETVRISGDSLIAVINDILDYSKVEAGKLDLETLDFDLRSTMEDVTDVLAVGAHTKGLELASLIDPEVPALVQGDPGRLRQILTNLANNAIKFTQKGEVVIRVTLEAEDNTCATVRFSVIDTGIGISRDGIDRLFQSFSQVDASTTRKYGGTGLGLAISQKLSGLMGGKIGVESEEGKGSTFWFTAVLEKQSEAQEVEKAVPEDIRKQRILIVDDNATNRQVLKQQLKPWGCRFDEASDGQQALDRFRQAVADGDPFGIGILDMQMPVMDGETLGLRIKEDPDIKDTILIMLTSLGQRGDAARMKEIGFAAYLTKPIKRSVLYDCLATITGMRKEATDEDSASIVTKHSITDAQKRKVRILLAEDNMINQKVALNILDKLGYRADAVANGKEAVKALEMIAYDLVLMDVQMPEMDGFEATAEIRNQQSRVCNHDIPIIAMTAHAMKGDRERCLEAGMDDYTSKPIEPKQLVEKIEKWAGIGKEVLPDNEEGRKQPTDSHERKDCPPMDLKEATERVMGDTAFLETLVQQFLADLPAQIEELDEALKRGDAETLRQKAHRLKGSASNLSADSVADAACALEQIGREGNLDEGHGAMDGLLGRAAHLRDYISQIDLSQSKGAS
jgi:signal transduction histidine kinase/DNA-binding response OmpR family regulator/HPt (histidine-containing phosphotransfer) domain-containing protein